MGAWVRLNQHSQQPISTRRRACYIFIRAASLVPGWITDTNFRRAGQAGDLPIFHVRCPPHSRYVPAT